MLAALAPGPAGGFLRSVCSSCWSRRIQGSHCLIDCSLQGSNSVQHCLHSLSWVPVCLLGSERTAQFCQTNIAVPLIPRAHVLGLGVGFEGAGGAGAAYVGLPEQGRAQHQPPLLSWLPAVGLHSALESRGASVPGCSGDGGLWWGLRVRKRLCCTHMYRAALRVSAVPHVFSQPAATAHCLNSV